MPNNQVGKRGKEWERPLLMGPGEAVLVHAAAGEASFTAYLENDLTTSINT